MHSVTFIFHWVATGSLSRLVAFHWRFARIPSLIWEGAHSPLASSDPNDISVGLAFDYFGWVRACPIGL